MDNQQSLPVPLDGFAQAVTAQRNTALDEAAQWRAVAEQAIAERDQLRARLADREQPSADA
ncbi:hypothetical protein [Nonomuraea sp. B19D2]|uniref:hypothetical protein n=1 Tax=Nonomuraea sp. B19D2 TaxID=3159561 RepID=UPI0032DBC3B3